MIRRSAAENVDIVELFKFFIGKTHLGKIDLTVFYGVTDRIFHDLGLLVYLFHHKMLVAAFFGSFGIPGYFDQRLLDKFPVGIKKLCPAFGQMRYFTVAYIVDVTRIF